jgi:dTDP-4-dehydrorhamnose reductase
MERGGSGRALVIGGDSLVGAAVQARCRDLGMDVEVTSRRGTSGSLALDLSEPDFAPLALGDYQVGFVCAAVTSMQACQDDPQGSRRVNVANTLELMRRLTGQGTHLVFLSSSQVFDGETPAPAEDAPTAPRNEYGAQKLAVEQAIAREGLRAAVLRPTKILAERPVGVFEGWFKALSQGRPVRAATNLALSPVMVSDVADAAVRLAQQRRHGIWHLGSSDDIGYFEAARLMAEMQGFPPALVEGEELTEAKVPSIFRHRHVTISCDKIARELGVTVRSARAILEALFSRFPRPAAAGRMQGQRAR